MNMIDYAPAVYSRFHPTVPDLFLLCPSCDKKSPGVIKIEFGSLGKTMPTWPDQTPWFWWFSM